MFCPLLDSRTWIQVLTTWWWWTEFEHVWCSGLDFFNLLKFEIWKLDLFMRGLVMDRVLRTIITQTRQKPEGINLNPTWPEVCGRRVRPNTNVPTYKCVTMIYWPRNWGRSSASVLNFYINVSSVISESLEVLFHSDFREYQKKWKSAIFQTGKLHYSFKG